MKPELYLNLISPPVRSVLLLIEELGIDVEKKNIDFYTGEHLGESYLKVIIIYFRLNVNVINGFSL